jgi:hypothetical protein
VGCSLTGARNTLAIKHSTTKTDHVSVYDAASWNADHTIDDNTITEALLDAVNGPTDTYVLSFDVASGRLKWVPNASVTAIVSVPPEGSKKVLNIYWNPVTQELAFDVED